MAAPAATSPCSHRAAPGDTERSLRRAQSRARAQAFESSRWCRRRTKVRRIWRASYARSPGAWCERSIRRWRRRHERRVRARREGARVAQRSACAGGSLRGPGRRLPFRRAGASRGRDLEQRLRQRPLPSNEIKRLGVQVLRTLEVAHAAGIVHAAITPGHVVLSDGAIPAGWIRLGSCRDGRRPGRSRAVGRLLREAAGGTPTRRVGKTLSQRPRTATAFREALETAPYASRCCRDPGLGQRWPSSWGSARSAHSS